MRPLQWRNGEPADPRRLEAPGGPVVVSVGVDGGRCEVPPVPGPASLLRRRRLSVHRTQRSVIGLLATFVVVAVAGCGTGSGGAGRATGSSSPQPTPIPSGVASPTGSPSRSSVPSVRPGTRGLWHGSYQARSIALPGGGVGVAVINGSAGENGPFVSVIERTTDGGRTWAAGRWVVGEDQPGAQTGMVFGSAQQGWVYGPELFFTRDGAATWHAAPATAFKDVGQAAVAGTSLWVAGYPCRSGRCAPAIYGTDHVGGPFHRLPDQPPMDENLLQMQRPTPSAAWLLFGPTGHRPPYLVTTSDAGRSWSRYPLPCPWRFNTRSQLSAVGPRSGWLVCIGTPGAGSLPELIYRTIDGGHSWIRVAHQYSLSVQAVSNQVAWAVESDPSSSLIVRTTDGGHTWHTVLSRSSAKLETVEALVPQGPKGAHAIASVFTSGGERFVAYRTRNAGKTWQRTPLPAPQQDQ